MKITAVRTTPLRIPYALSYHMTQGARTEASMVLVEVETDDGLTGIGESMARPDAAFVENALADAAEAVIGQDPFAVDALMAEVHRRFMAIPSADMDRMARLAVAGLDMALWDLAGKAAGRPVHALLGGAVHDHVQYFAFIEGETPDVMAEDARRYLAEGIEVFYVKLGRGDDEDVACAAAIRDAIGDKRLRLDANEAWDMMGAIHMIKRLEPFDPEFIEQPVSSHSMDALRQVKEAVQVPIAADQAIHSPADVYAYCRARAADVIVLGVHEAGGLGQMRKAAAVADAAGIRICLHGVPESGITTTASHHLALSLPNIDDGNQIMCRFLAEDLISAPDLTLVDGRLPVFDGPGLGLTLDRDAIGRAAARAAAAKGN